MLQSVFLLNAFHVKALRKKGGRGGKEMIKEEGNKKEEGGRFLHEKEARLFRILLPSVCFFKLLVTLIQ